MKNQNYDVNLSSTALNLQECFDFVKDEKAGGIALFVGTVRNQTNGKAVQELHFSSYQPMALKELKKIALSALSQFTILKIAIHHVEGELKIGEIPVIIAVSSAHRAAAFSACQFAINSLKKKVPIWKKEFFENGAVWVNATP
ncbi:molybdenum cofactor biosynthesis protein MoaE [Flavobacteriaceae bacterium F08102]|nr:molybdenum cofactor biosynthesis protein MoaE [Flavobacteriaceae bacterium F08102]